MPDPSYPAMPAYGEGAPAAPPRAEDTGTRSVWLTVAGGVVFNLLALVGVLLFGWPPGNVFALFWVENVVLGLCTLAKVATARAPSTGRVVVNGRSRQGSPALYAVFFCVHYGIFCLVHLAFTAVVAYRVGLAPTPLLLGLPVVLLLVRYGVELTTWFGDGGQRDRLSPQTAMLQPYPRVVVLHLAVMFGFALVIVGFTSGITPGGGDLERYRALLPVAWRSDGVLVVAVLVALKTVVDVLTTRRALRR